MYLAYVPWAEIAVLVALLGAGSLAFVNDPFLARKWSSVFAGMILILSLFAWDMVPDAHDPRVELPDQTFLELPRLLHIDPLSAPLLPLVSMLYFTTILVTPRTKLYRFSFSGALASQAVALIALGVQNPWWVIGTQVLLLVPTWAELRSRGQSTRLFVFHMALFALMAMIGQYIVETIHADVHHSLKGIFLAPLVIAVLIRSGVAPFHLWVGDLLERASFGSSVLTLAPMWGVYVAARLVLPVADEQALRAMGLLTFAAALYSGGLTLVQKESRRLFACLVSAQSSIILAGLEMVTPMGLAGALCVWLSTGLALTGFGLTLRALEARLGRLSLKHPSGLYDHAPAFAVCYLLTGLACVGFPGTFGFVGNEMLVDGAVEAYHTVGIAVILEEAMSGIAIMRTYFLLFGGPRHRSAISLGISARERIAVLILASLIFIGGILPTPTVHSRHHAAEHILKARNSPQTVP